MADDDYAPRASRPAGRFDPLIHPVMITGQCVIGDQLRVPATWCAMAGCEAAFADPAALGEADNRARAIGAGWVKDALGRLVCPACQSNEPVPVWWIPPRQPGAAGDLGPAGGTSRPAGRANQPVREAAGGPPPATAQGRHPRTQWPRRLFALAAAGDGKSRDTNAGYAAG